MENEALKKMIIDVLSRSKLASVATVKGNLPRVRYMMVMQDKGLNLWTTTFSKSRKVEEIKKNKNVYLTIGGDEKNMMSPYVNIQATAEIATDTATKKQYWNDMLKAYYSGPEDPNLAIIKIFPKVIEYMTPGNMKPEVLTLS